MKVTMAVPIKRVPPPPPIAQNDPVFNRWLHDLTSFIQEGGGIAPGTIPGYDHLLSTVATHSIQISSLIVDVADNTSDIGVNTSAIATHTSQIATHTSQIASHTASITANTTAIATNTANIASNTSSISTLANRSRILNGVVAPTAGLGVDGDWFSDTVAKHIYVKVSGAWVLIV